jgi:hypothetical protein
MQLQKQRHHTKETSKGKDDYGRRSLLPDIDLALGKVVAERQGLHSPRSQHWNVS